MKKTSLPFGIFITIIAYFFFAIAAACVRAIGNNCSAMQILFIQNIICLILILPYCLKINHLTIKTPNLNLHLLRDISGLLSYYTYYVAIKYLDLVDATVLSYTAPFYIPFIWWIWKKEKIPHGVWWSIILGFVGITLILRPSMQFMLIGTLIALASGICSSFALISIRMLNQKEEPLSTTLFYFFLVGTIITLPFFLFDMTWPLSMKTWLYIFGVGFATAIGQIFLTAAYRHGSASFLSPLSYFIVVFSSLISVIIFHVIPHWSAFLGMGLIIFGGSMSFIFSHKARTFMSVFAIYKKPWWKKILLFWEK
jgi:drug/metabolite transporter (DMT)-like permease